MSAKRPRIPTNPPQTGLGNPFGELEAAGLPEGPAPVPSTPADLARPTKLGRVVLRKEKSGRGGKTVIVVDDFASHLSMTFLETVARKLRNSCGCGGTMKGRTIEMQGDQPGRIREVLLAEGFQVAGIQ